MGREIPGDIAMTNATSFAPTAQPVAIPIREVLPCAIFGGLLLMLAIYFVGADQHPTQQQGSNHDEGFLLVAGEAKKVTPVMHELVHIHALDQ